MSNNGAFLWRFVRFEAVPRGMYTMGTSFQMLCEKWLGGCHRHQSLKWWVEIIRQSESLEMEDLHIWDWMWVLMGAPRDTVMRSMLLFLQTFAAQLSSSATLCIDGVVFECLLIESEDDNDREREQGCFNLWHLSHLFEIWWKIHFFFALRHPRHAI